MQIPIETAANNANTLNVKSGRLREPFSNYAKKGPCTRWVS